VAQQRLPLVESELRRQQSRYQPGQQTIDARGSAGTIYAGYDATDRQIWRNTSNSPTNAYVTDTSDIAANGNNVTYYSSRDAGASLGLFIGATAGNNSTN